ncbi:hypothetical protein HAX54_013759 [Datura stramonium]|uniref:Uncharacterized protein n=1 Tax=Datura stramonium TaxID=4076 RepID=A0ABS8TPG5_DATST|nr:hypothetical protein [Datura stramonium]
MSIDIALIVHIDTYSHGVTDACLSVTINPTYSSSPKHHPSAVSLFQNPFLFVASQIEPIHLTKGKTFPDVDNHLGGPTVLALATAYSLSSLGSMSDGTNIPGLMMSYIIESYSIYYDAIDYYETRRSHKEVALEGHSVGLKHHHGSVSSNSEISRLLLENEFLRLDNENHQAQIFRNEEVATARYNDWWI